MILMRMSYFVYKKLQRKEVWLLMDRVDKADDNAEHLMRYLNTQDETSKRYYVISKDSPDYERMKQYGNVVEYNSKRHKWLQLVADKVISSHIEDTIRVPLQGNAKYVRELSNFKYIFLQHGIIKDDLSGWLNKYNKNIDAFVTSTKAEYDSILEGDYKYNEDVVKLTGLPRYDRLKNQDQKQILIMPTWRSKEVSEIDPNSGVRPYNDRFKESQYFKAYNKLINNEKLLKACEEYGYKIVFFPHPAIWQQMKDFNQNEQVIFEDYNQSYQKMFNESSLLLTDYSSVAFDFAYMKKPVLYYQFDREQFFKGHTYTEGYFDYETMGFGEVIVDEEEVINQVIAYMKNECAIKEVYKERINNFYCYTDQDNCKRVYDVIKSIK
ncbi:CDP-glycerol glycerophosphotransferase family protein [Cellulosilyticum ruminicola]|uniref:CDP-glycerol glycerophosphotransferase family protein n=1 Tax=Cellulosilyticum ruminicola TaxID=425254 RepID=UPI0006CF749E|nr:CDP-glycerol glycerophosphotransferase family protein [Cellulosilyticum ruminicola]